MDLRERLARHRAEEQQLSWEGTFLDYFEIVRQNPAVADLAHARVYRMLMDSGVSEEEEGLRAYNFFSRDIFGLERPLEQLVEYFRSAAQRLEVRKRILLLMGPVGGGKSTIVSLLKRGLERFCRSETGAVYAIKGWPMLCGCRPPRPAPYRSGAVAGLCAKRGAPGQPGAKEWDREVRTEAVATRGYSIGRLRRSFVGQRYQIDQARCAVSRTRLTCFYSTTQIFCFDSENVVF